ncbi:MAG: histidine kinase, partial [Desulfobacterales bacterium S5133MH16]
FRATTKKILDKRGFDTIVAESGEAAIDKIKENPDVVILDIKMPGIDGHEALKQIKKLKPDLPVIMLTGHGALPSAMEALATGAFDYLSKPCDIDLLASKITDAYQQKEKKPREEKRVVEIMVPIDNYTTLDEEQTVSDAILKLKESFSSMISTSRLMESSHRSVLVFDNTGNVKGLLVIDDLLEGIKPAYLKAAKPSMADSIVYSPMFWSGMFTTEVKRLAKMKIKEVMSAAPPTIDVDANLMEASHMMMKNKVSRLAVTKQKDVVGVIREHDLFFETERVIKG